MHACGCPCTSLYMHNTSMGRYIARVYIHTHVRAYMDVYVYVCLHTSRYTCMHKHLFSHVGTHIQEATGTKVEEHMQSMVDKWAPTLVGSAVGREVGRWAKHVVVNHHPHCDHFRFSPTVGLFPKFLRKRMP